MIDKIKNTIVSNQHFFKYAIIGISGVTVDIVSFALFVRLGIPPVIATIISTSLGIINNFLLNAFLNFKKRNKILNRFVKFYGIGLIGIIITAGLIYLLHDTLGLDPLISKLITIPPVVAVQFLLNKHISFSDRSVRKYVRSIFKNLEQ